MLMNIGFAESLKDKNYTCFIFHDVDLLPEHDHNIYSCNLQSPRHMSAAVDKFKYKLPYPREKKMQCINQIITSSGRTTLRIGRKNTDEENEDEAEEEKDIEDEKEGSGLISKLLSVKFTF